MKTLLGLFLLFGMPVVLLVVGQPIAAVFWNWFMLIPLAAQMGKLRKELATTKEQKAWILGAEARLGQTIRLRREE